MSFKWIKVKETGVETRVDEAYFKQHEGDGWFIEINDPEEKPKAAKAPKVKEKPEAVEEISG